MILTSKYKKATLLFFLLVFTLQVFGQAQTPVKKKPKKKKTYTAADYMNLGNDKAKEAKYTDAIVYYDKSIAINGYDYQTWYNRGFCKEKLFDYEAAIPDFTQSIKLHQPVAFPDGLFHRGYCYNKTGLYVLAISDFNKALEVTSNADIWAARGFANLQNQNFEDGVSDYSRAIALEGNIEYYGLRALCYYNLHKLPETIKDAEKFLEKKPASPDIVEIQLKAKYEMQDFAGALPVADRLLSLKKSPLNYYYKASVEYYLKKYPEAIGDFTSAIALDSNYRDAYYCRGLSYLGLNDDANACPDLHKAEKLGFPGLKGKIDAYCKDIKQ